MSLKKPEKKPRVSVIIPAYNEEKTIARCIRSLVEQSLDSSEYEIIVVDNNCTDKTIEIVKLFPDIKIVKESNPGVGAARYRGWQEARGDIIASTDADCEAPKHWLKKTIHYFDTHSDVVAISGGYLFYDRDFVINIIVRIFERSLVTLSWFLAGGVMALTANNMAVRKSVYDKTTGIDKNLQFGEDLNLAKKMHTYGKIKWLFHNRVKTSARRYQEMDLSVVPYFLNFLSMSARDKTWRNRLDNIRK
ncbi:MAG: glycosyltransferase family A protein [bacterium]|nr:glycosyltransferase family A protein [bacterium]